MPQDIFVIGTTSLDILHLGEQTVTAPGGAGMYTALAAKKAGATAGLFGPYPKPMPATLQSIVEAVTWIGPTISLDQLPRLEIAHYGGGKAELRQASWGAEPSFVPVDIPMSVTSARFVHIAALSTANRQLDFLLAFLQHKTGSEAVLSVGTYGKLVYEQTERVEQLLSLADLFFMNENEAKGLFGQVEQAYTRPDALIFITLGERGVLVIEGNQTTHIPAVPIAEEVDPTGAGDTFCGATLAGLVKGLSPVEAARQGVKLAALTVTAIGPTALLS